MGDVKSGARKKKPNGQKNSYYYALTYDEEDSGSVDETGVDDLQKRVANILAETEDMQYARSNEAEQGAGRLDFNDNMFHDDGSHRHSRSLDFEISDDEFQSAESKSDTERPEPDLENASIEGDFVQITRPVAESRGRVGSGGDGRVSEDGSRGPEISPTRTTASLKRPGSNPLAVVYVKQKPSTELYDGKFIDDDILQPQDDKTIGDNISQDLLPMPDEMTLEIEEDDDDEEDGNQEIVGGVDEDPIIFRKSSERFCVRHRKLMIGVAIVASFVAVGGIAAIIYFAIRYST